LLIQALTWIMGVYCVGKKVTCCRISC